MTSVNPTATSAHASSICYNSHTGNIVLLDQGAFPSFTQPNCQTYFWNGTTWALQNVTNPSIRSACNIAFDGSSNTVIGFGGKGLQGAGAPNYSSSGILYDTVQSSTGNWTEVSPATNPPQRYNGYLVPLTNQVMMFGGLGEYFMQLDQWSYASGAWTQVTPAAQYPARKNAAVASNGTDTILMFGGSGTGAQSYNDIWKYTVGSGTWTQLTPVNTGPSVRDSASMTYSPTLGLYILQGGKIESTVLGDTWTFNLGTLTWTQINTTNSLYLYGALLVSSGSQTLLFGGSNGYQLMNSTYLYQSSNWVKQ